MDYEMIVLRAASEAQSKMLPSFGGLTLKDVGEVAKMTMTRDEAVSQRGVNETRRGYKNLKGIQQVDTNMQYYVCPSYLQEWLDTNKGFFLKPLHPSLVPRGILGDGPPGCLSGDTVLRYKRGKRNSSRPIKLQSLYRKFNGLPDAKDPPRIDAPTYLHSMQEDGSVKYNRIISIIESGERECIRITTTSGRSLVLTPDHPVCLGSGEFVEAGSLQQGTVLRMKGNMLPQYNGGKKKREIHRREICVKHHPIAGVKIVEGVKYRRLHFSMVMIEADMNKLSLHTYLKRLNNGALGGLSFLSSDQEVHHRDENLRNDRLDNLEVMTKAAHAQHHGKGENFNVEYLVNEAVILVEDAGITLTYDIQMDSPARNLVADSFIVLDGCSGLCSD